MCRRQLPPLSAALRQPVAPGMIMDARFKNPAPSKWVNRQPMDFTQAATIGMISAVGAYLALKHMNAIPMLNAPQLRPDKRRGPREEYVPRAKIQRGDHSKSQMADMLATGDHLRPESRFGKSFRPIYRIPASMFEDIYSWMDTNRIPFEFQKRDHDCTGLGAIPLKLKALAGFFMLSSGLQAKPMAHQIGCDEETMRVFFLKFNKALASLEKDWIKLPETAEEVRTHTLYTHTHKHTCHTHLHTSPILQLQAHVATYAGEDADGLPGCMGSIDCTHIGWTRCLTSVRSWYVGKEGVPTVSFQVCHFMR